MRRYAVDASFEGGGARPEIAAVLMSMSTIFGSRIPFRWWSLVSTIFEGFWAPRSFGAPLGLRFCLDYKKGV